MIGRLYERLWLAHYRRQGLQVSEDCRFMSRPDFGSEPYLVSIGRHVTLAPKVSFITHDGGTFVFRDQERYRGVIKYGRIVVHDNCFIGYRVTILPGVSIGPNAVVAAGAVVARDLPPNTVAGGVPARPLMSIEEYAERSLRETPEYDREAYARDKVAELLRLYPRPW